MNKTLISIWIATCLLACGESSPSVQSPTDDQITGETETDSTISTTGYHMLLIGNSFFKPYAENLDEMAIEAGFENHKSTRITRGGENGWASSFWNDSLTQEHKEIKAALDQGDVELFGMTSGGAPENRIEGHKAWIEYALEKNPDISIFIAIAAVDYPTEWDQRAEDYGFDSIEELYDFFVNDLVPDSIVKPLREAFPTTPIFTIPTGLATLKLTQMQEDDTLLDEISYEGPKSTSLFKDFKGHQGDIIIETGTLVWLSSIYNVKLDTFSYDTGFNTDLHSIANDIISDHNVGYKW